MIGKALGLIETVGLAAAIEAADTALKTANIDLIGYELTNGGGMVTVKIKGDVSAVNTALTAAKMSASKVGSVYAVLVIPRPNRETEIMINTDSTVGLERVDDMEFIGTQFDENDNSKNDVTSVSNGADMIITDDVVRNDVEERVSNEIDETEFIQLGKEASVENKKEVCNICHDPLCTRKKGQPRSLCIHYNELHGGDHK